MEPPAEIARRARLCLLLAACPALARAETPPPASAPIPVPRPNCPTGAAIDAYLDGRRLLASGSAAAAVEPLSRARAECPAPTVEFYLAVAFDALGQRSLALDALTKYLAGAGPARNRPDVEAWAAELRQRLAAERDGLPAPRLPARAPPSPPAPYLQGEERRLAPRAPPARSSTGEGEQWLFFAGAGFAANVRLQPGSVGGRAGAYGDQGVDYQIGAAYRIERRARLGLEALIAGQAFSFHRIEAAGDFHVGWVNLLAVGLRMDLPLLARGALRVFASPSVAAGLASLSEDLATSYRDALGVRFALGLAIEQGGFGGFVEPDCLLLFGPGIANPQWTLGVTAGLRHRF